MSKELWNIALDEGSSGEYPGLSYAGNPTDPNSTLAYREVFARAMAEDGYAYGTDGIELAVRNVGRDPVTINDVRLVDIATRCAPDGLLVLYGNEGGEAMTVLQFDLRAAIPLAYDGAQGGKVSFFDKSKIPVQPAAEEYLRIEADAYAETYFYRVEVSYTTGGASYSQVFGRSGGGPFRVTARTCPTAEVRRELTDADIARLRNHRWKQIRQRASPGPSGESIVAVDPDAYVASCLTN